MVPMAILVGRKADAWGRKPIFLAGFAVLPLRGVLYTLAQNPYALVSIQILDGIGAGIFGALFYIVVAAIPIAIWAMATGMRVGKSDIASAPRGCA